MMRRLRALLYRWDGEPFYIFRCRDMGWYFYGKRYATLWAIVRDLRDGYETPELERVFYDDDDDDDDDDQLLDSGGEVVYNGSRFNTNLELGDD